MISETNLLLLYHVADYYREDEIEETVTTETVAEGLRADTDLQTITMIDGEEGEVQTITAAEALLPLTVHAGAVHLPIEAIEIEVGAAVDGARACREFLSWSVMSALKLPPKTCKWPLEELAMCATSTSHETTIRNSPKALPLSSTPIWIKHGKLVMKWIDSESKGANWKWCLLKKSESHPTK